MDRGLSRANAVAAAARANPDLHRQFLVATNGENPSAQRLLEDPLGDRR